MPPISISSAPLSSSVSAPSLLTKALTSKPRKTHPSFSITTGFPSSLYGFRKVTLGFWKNLLSASSATKTSKKKTHKPQTQMYRRRPGTNSSNSCSSTNENDRLSFLCPGSVVSQEADRRRLLIAGHHGRWRQAGSGGGYKTIEREEILP
jgi:hypothetical protein